jgi:hypothetical protein
LTDDRKCDVGFCVCADAHERERCKHFHMPRPSIGRSKEQRLGTSRAAFDKQRDKIVRKVEGRTTNNAVEDKLAETRRNPRKRLKGTVK